MVLSIPWFFQYAVIFLCTVVVLVLSVFLFKSQKNSSDKVSVDDTTPSKIPSHEYGTHECLECDRNFEPSFILCTDLDNTLLGTDEAIQKFNRLWCDEFALRGGILVYATGRSETRYKDACQEHPSLMTPDILICQDGVVIKPCNKELCEIFGVTENEWAMRMDRSWDQTFGEKIHSEVAEAFELLQPKCGSQFIKPFRIAALLKNHEQADEALEHFRRRVDERNQQNVSEKVMRVNLFTCSDKPTGGCWAAFTPEDGGKGKALEFIARKMKIAFRHVVVCGDSGNDVSMFKINFARGVLVGNSSRELLNFYDEHQRPTRTDSKRDLLFRSEHMKTDGVIDGLMKFRKFFPNFDDDDDEFDDDDDEFDDDDFSDDE